MRKLLLEAVAQAALAVNGTLDRPSVTSFDDLGCSGMIRPLQQHFLL